LKRAPRPWWAASGRALLEPRDIASLPLSALWDLSERLAYVRDNVDGRLLAIDFAAHDDLAKLWADLGARGTNVGEALTVARALIVTTLRSKNFSPEIFRRDWEALGFIELATRASTAADDYLEGLLEVRRFSTGEERPAFGLVNLASRAVRIADFLAALEPGPSDVLYDLGSGCGKFVTTVAASCRARVIGIELGASWVASSRETAARLGIANAEFQCADVHDVDFSNGTQFYLYHPFYGEVAKDTARALATVAAQKKISVYLQGPMLGFAEHFERYVASGQFASVERHGQITLLRS
jgi:predicted RNA methylase